MGVTDEDRITDAVLRQHHDYVMAFEPTGGTYFDLSFSHIGEEGGAEPARVKEVGAWVASCPRRIHQAPNRAGRHGWSLGRRAPSSRESVRCAERFYRYQD